MHKTKKATKQKGHKFTEEEVGKMHKKKKTFWSKATGGRMY